MDEEERAFFLDKFKSLVEGHPVIPTNTLRQLLVQAVALHQEAEQKGKSPMLEIMVCPVIAVIRELLKYRDQYGLIELPDEEWRFFDDSGNAVGS